MEERIFSQFSREGLLEEAVMRLFELTPEALRIYEEKGLVRPRCEAGERYYEPEELERLSLVLTLMHDWAMSLSKVRRMLEGDSLRRTFVEEGEGRGAAA